MKDATESPLGAVTATRGRQPTRDARGPPHGRAPARLGRDASLALQLGRPGVVAGVALVVHALVVERVVDLKVPVTLVPAASKVPLTRIVNPEPVPTSENVLFDWIEKGPAALIESVNVPGGWHCDL